MSSRDRHCHPVRSLVAAAALVVVGACTDATTDDTGDAAPQEEPAAVDDPAEPDAEDGGDVEVVDDDAEEVSAPAVAEDQPPRAPFSLPEIELTTPGAGGGVRPELGWAPVDGAAAYSVTVYAASGQAWWAWHGTETSTVVGGGEPVPAGEEVADGGPVVGEGMSWDVVALDADGTPIAHSPVRPLSP